MSKLSFFVVLDSNGRIVAVADPTKAPKGMSYSIATKQEYSVLEVDAPEDLMRQAHGEMKRMIKERIDAGASRPHLKRVGPH